MPCLLLLFVGLRVVSGEGSDGRGTGIEAGAKHAVLVGRMAGCGGKVWLGSLPACLPAAWHVPVGRTGHGGLSAQRQSVLAGAGSGKPAGVLDVHCCCLPSPATIKVEPKQPHVVVGTPPLQCKLHFVILLRFNKKRSAASPFQAVTLAKRW